MWLSTYSFPGTNFPSFFWDSSRFQHVQEQCFTLYMDIEAKNWMMYIALLAERNDFPNLQAAGGSPLANKRKYSF